LTPMAKIFLFIAIMYLVAKAVLVYILYLVTLKVEEKALEHKRKREKILRVRRMKNMELYRRQYQDSESGRRNIRVVKN
jgi:proteasome assembly chaperone (PAC2) family protein